MTKRMPPDVEKRIDKMTEMFRNNLVELYQWSNSETESGPTAAQIEGKIRAWIQQVGQDTQVLLLGGMDRNRRKGKQKCPACEQETYWKRYESRNYITSLGPNQLILCYLYKNLLASALFNSALCGVRGVEIRACLLLPCSLPLWMGAFR